MDTQSDKQLTLLNEAHATAVELLRVTKLLALTGETENQEKEVSDFHFLIEKREPMFERLALIKKMIDDTPEGAHSATCAARWEKTQQVLAQIVTLDKAHLDQMEQIRNSVKSSIKDINSGKKLSRMYAHPSDHAQTTGFLDTKK